MSADASRSTALLTDRYELTMLDAALRDGTADRRCVFELFGRRLSGGRRFGVVAGTGRLLSLVGDFRFGDDELRLPVRFGREDHAAVGRPVRRSVAHGGACARVRPQPPAAGDQAGRRRQPQHQQEHALDQRAGPLSAIAPTPVDRRV